ncbi:MAG TPA: YbaB/EbfC family nucleoid-associated protein [Alphaproteobacteria bacterium]|nr:YbaB/EbfC family nucleoid-associated protein [Alphaproteobacteria bacterium]
MHDFEELLSSTRAELDRLKAQRARHQAPGQGVGRALDGLIEVSMAPDGRLSRLQMDPSVMRMDERILAREIMTAVNIAWASRQGADEAAAATAAIDPAALQQRLTEIQDQGMASMRRFTDGMRDILDRLERRVP